MTCTTSGGTLCADRTTVKRTLHFVVSNGQLSSRHGFKWPQSSAPLLHDEFRFVCDDEIYEGERLRRARIISRIAACAFA